MLNKWDGESEAGRGNLDDPEDKVQSRQWLPSGRSGSAPAEVSWSCAEAMATVFWDAQSGWLLTPWRAQE